MAKQAKRGFFLFPSEAQAIAYSKRRSRAGLYEALANEARRVAGEAQGLILNIGAGGDIQKTLEGNGVTVTSVDIDPARNPDVVGSVTDLSGFADGSVSHIFCMEVLEHVDNPFRAAQEMRRVLAEGGTVVGSTPFILGIHDRPHDFFRFTKYGIRLLFRDFEELNLKERNSLSDAVCVLPLRLLVTGTTDERSVLRAKFPLLRLALGLLGFAMRGVGGDDCTTGYFFVYRKGNG